MTGSDFQDCTGKYTLANETCDRDPSLPVYKHEEKDRYIYSTGIDDAGWRICEKKYLSGNNAGGSWFKSNSFL